MRADNQGSMSLVFAFALPFVALSPFPLIQFGTVIFTI